MRLPTTRFAIVADSGCPLYALGDDIRLSDYSIVFPDGKATCIILVLDITETFYEWEKRGGGAEAIAPSGYLRCGGCGGGVIRLAYGNAAAGDKKPAGGSHLAAVTELLRGFSIFQSIEPEHIREIVPLMTARKCRRGETVLTCGDPGRHLYIILSGRMEILSAEGVHMAFLESGEVFGEMSLLSGDPVGATVKAASPSTLFRLESRDFRRVLNQFPSLQMYFARLLARRLARSNLERSTDFGAAMVGHLSEMSPSELFQAMNVNQKSGVFHMEVSGGPGVVIFREGELVAADYRGKTGKPAFYDILMEREGRFKFSPEPPAEAEGAEPLGNFMWLLMEGARIQDEVSGSVAETAD